MRCKYFFFLVVFVSFVFIVGCDENGNLKHDVKGILSPVDDDFYIGTVVENNYKIDFYHDYGYATDSFPVQLSEYKVLDTTKLPEGVEFPKDESGKVISKKRLYFKNVGTYDISIDIKLGLKKLTVSGIFDVKKYPKTFGIIGKSVPNADRPTGDFEWDIDLNKKGIWTSSDESIFTVVSTGDKSCTLTALKLGSANLIVTADDPDYNYTEEIVINVGLGVLPAVESVVFAQADNATLSGDITGVISGSEIVFNILAADYGDGSSPLKLTTKVNEQSTSNDFPAEVKLIELKDKKYKVSKDVFGSPYEVEYTCKVSILN